MTRSALSLTIRAIWDSIQGYARAEGVPNPVLRAGTQGLPSGPLKLLGTSNKVEKGSQGYLPAVLYLSGAHAAETLCPDATPACRAVCLGHRSGRLAFDAQRRAQAWKTTLYHGHRGYFLSLLVLDLEALAAKARREGLVPAVRLDGASDTGLAHDPTVRTHLSRLGIVAWDYSRNLDRATNHPGEVTASYPGPHAPWEPYRALLALGGRVAVISPDPRPESLGGFPTADGDASDLRFLDAPGSVVWLSPKGNLANKRKALDLGFATPLATLREITR